MSRIIKSSIIKAVLVCIALILICCTLVACGKNDSRRKKSEKATELSYKTLKGTWKGEVSISLNQIKPILQMSLDSELSDVDSLEQKEKATRVVNELIDFLYDISDGNSEYFSMDILMSVISENELTTSVNVKMNEKEFQKFYSSEDNAVRFLTILLGEEEIKSAKEDGDSVQDYAKTLIDLYAYAIEQLQEALSTEEMAEEKYAYEVKDNKVVLLNDDEKGINLVLEYNQQRDSLSIQNVSEIERKLKESQIESMEFAFIEGFIISILQDLELKKIDDSQQVLVPTGTNSLVQTNTPTSAPTYTPTIMVDPTKTPAPTAAIPNSPSPTKVPVINDVNTHRTSIDNINVEQYLNGYYQGYVSTETAAVHTGPGGKDYPRLTLNDGKEVVLSKGTEVFVWGEARDKDHDIWYHITATVNNQQIEGYVYVSRVNRESTQITIP